MESQKVQALRVRIRKVERLLYGASVGWVNYTLLAQSWFVSGSVVVAHQIASPFATVRYFGVFGISPRGWIFQIPL